MKNLARYPLFALALLALASSAVAQTFTVGPDIACDFEKLDEAVDFAPEGSHIEVAAGTYIFDTVNLQRSVWISGGHDGCGGAPMPGKRSILDGDEERQVMDLVTADEIVVILQRLELRDGRATLDQPGPLTGAGMRIGGPAVVALVDVIFNRNVSLIGGALDVFGNPDGIPEVYFFSVGLLRNEAVWQGEAATGWGGGIACSGGALLELQDTTFLSNSATEQGGGLYSAGCTVRYETGTMKGNTAGGPGGGIWSWGGILELGDGGDRDLKIQASTSPSFGGGIFAFGGTFEADGVEISGNTAKRGGGIYLSSLDDTAILGEQPCPEGGCVRFQHNEATEVGGALYLRETSARIFGAVGKGNEAAGQGGFLLALGDEKGLHLEVLSSVIQGGGGKSQVYSRTAGKTHVVSSVLRANPSPNPMLDLDDGESLVSHVIFWNNAGPATLLDPDIVTCNLFAPGAGVPANSVFTLFGDPKFVGPDDHHLQAGSDAIDQCPSGLFEAASHDMDGDARPDANLLNDVGADEVM